LVFFTANETKKKKKQKTKEERHLVLTLALLVAFDFLAAHEGADLLRIVVALSARFRLHLEKKDIKDVAIID